MDIAPALLQSAAYRGHTEAQWFEGDATKQFPAGPWDAVSFFNSFEQIPSQARQAVLVKARDSLAPGGRLLITFPWDDGDASQRFVWPVRPKTTAQWLAKLGFEEIMNGPLDEPYWGMVWRKPAAVPDVGTKSLTEATAEPIAGEPLRHNASGYPPGPLGPGAGGETPCA